MKSRLPGGRRRGGPARVSSFCRPTLKINTKCRRLFLCGLISLLFVFGGRRDRVSLSSQTRLEWEIVSRGVGPELVISSLPHLPGGSAQFSIHWSRRPGSHHNASDWRGGGRSTNRKKHLLLIFKSHAYVCEWTGVGRVVIAGKELAQQCGGPRPRLPPTTPTPARIYAEKISDMVTRV